MKDHWKSWLSPLFSPMRPFPAMPKNKSIYKMLEALVDKCKKTPVSLETLKLVDSKITQAYAAEAIGTLEVMILGGEIQRLIIQREMEAR